jgi:hypothetical protein
VSIPQIVADIYAAKARDYPEAGILLSLDKGSMLEVLSRLGNSMVVLGFDVVRFDSLGRPNIVIEEIWYLREIPVSLPTTSEWRDFCCRSNREARRAVESTPDSTDNSARFIMQSATQSEFESYSARSRIKYNRSNGADGVHQSK